jgi:iron only hydrogenase large subunit-like protein
MPCTAKKFEAARPEHTAGAGGAPHVDYVLTTRELGRLFRYAFGVFAFLLRF